MRDDRGSTPPDTASATEGSPSDGTPLTREEFERMTADLAHPLYAAAMRLARRRADAEDLVQDTLHRAWRSVRTFRRGSRFPAWMFRILHNAFLNRVRHEAMAPEVADPTTLDTAAPETPVPDLRSVGDLPAIADRHFDDRVKRAVEDLSETYRVPFLLFALGNLSYEEISATLGIPMGTVMSRLHRARSQLRERLIRYAREERVGGAAIRPDGEATDPDGARP